MTSPTFTQQQILAAKENASLYGVREEVSDDVAITFLFWRSRQDHSPSYNKTKEYWDMIYKLVE